MTEFSKLDAVPERHKKTISVSAGFFDGVSRKSREPELHRVSASSDGSRHVSRPLLSFSPRTILISVPCEQSTGGTSLISFSHNRAYSSAGIFCPRPGEKGNAAEKKNAKIDNK